MVGFDNSGNDDFKYVPVRRLTLLIEESLYRGLRFAVFEPNDEPLWAQIRLAAGGFMNGLFRQGAFKGAKASDAYFVKCDAETTTQNDIDLGIVNVVVGFAPLKPAEFIIVVVGRSPAKLQVYEAGGTASWRSSPSTRPASTPTRTSSSGSPSTASRSPGSARSAASSAPPRW